MSLQIPLVPKAAARDYANNAWHLGRGVKPILDDVTIQFATDFANCCIKDAASLCYKYAKAQLLLEIRQLKAEKAAQDAGQPVDGATQTVPSAAPQGRIILTD